MLQVTSRPGSSHMPVGWHEPQTQERIPSLPAAVLPNSSQLQQSNHDNPVSFNPCILHPMLITILTSNSAEDMVTAPASLQE